jgi:hypothetical protein
VLPKIDLDFVIVVNKKGDYVNDGFSQILKPHASLKLKHLVRKKVTPCTSVLPKYSI